MTDQAKKEVSRSEIQQYIETVFLKRDNELEEVIQSLVDHNMENISISPAAGKTLTMLVSATGAENILEIGALGGYSGICLARGMSSQGRLTSLELREDYAKLAHRNLKKSGYGEQVSYKTGPALESISELKQEEKRFDFIFIDADKENYQHYLTESMKIAEDGALIVADNTLAQGTVADMKNVPDRFTENMRNFNQVVADHPNLMSILMPIGDGLTISKVIKEAQDDKN